MSPTELLALSKGRIPAQIVFAEIVSYLEAQDDADASRTLAQKAGLGEDTINKWLFRLGTPEEPQSFAFDDVDRLFVAMGKVHLWRGEYIEYLERVDLRWTLCACPGCEVMFDASQGPQEGPTVRRYCSRACATSAAKQRTGATSRRVKVYNSPKKCRNGHAKTPENTKTRPDGRKECIICARAAANRCHARKMMREAA